MSEKDAGWVRKHAWTAAIRRLEKRQPGRFTTCGCERGLMECCASKGRRDHVHCPGGPVVVPEATIRAEDGRVLALPERYAHETPAGVGSCEPVLWLVGTACRWRCACSCHQSLVPGRPAAGVGETLDLFAVDAPAAAEPVAAPVEDSAVAESEEDAPTAPRPAKARRRKARTVPFDHKVGVTQFGRLTLVDGTVLLCETRLFHGHADGVEAVLVELIGGATRIVAGDGSLTWQAIEADAACDEAGLPHPEMLKHEDLARRLDPHHVERHANPLWRALVELVVARKLPCGFSLSALAADREVKRFEDAAAEDPGVFAAAVCERIARGAERDEAIVAELAGDARVAPEDIGPLLDETGWTEALAALPALLDAWRIVLPARMVTLTQPWASLVANGHKRHETRSLTTTWRGPLVIHAAKGFPADLPRGFCAELCRRPEFAAALDGRQLDDLPLGSVVALGMLTEVAPTAETDADVLAREGAFGDYGPGRYAWAVADVEPIEPAIPCSGARGLRRLPADVQRALAEHLAAKAGSPC